MSKSKNGPTRIMLVDDEQPCLDVLHALLTDELGDTVEIHMSSNPEEALQIIKKIKPDLVFMDIEMPLMNGFTLLDKLKPIDFEVIFTTAYDQFAVKAFRFSALDYLLKPLDPDELKDALVKYEERKSSESFNNQIDLLLDNINTQSNPFKRIAIHSNDGIMFTNVSEIIRCESENNYTYFFMTGNRKLLASRTLKDFEDLLSDSGFFRVHQSHLINLQHINRMIKGDGGYLIMSDNSNVPISRNKREALLKAVQD